METFKELWDYFNNIDNPPSVLSKEIFQPMLESVVALKTAIDDLDEQTKNSLKLWLTATLSYSWMNVEMKIGILDDFELLYDEKYSKAMFKKIVVECVQPMISKTFAYMNSIDVDWARKDKLADYSFTIANQTTSYSGFDVSNQDGNFNKVGIDSKATTTNKLGFIDYINNLFVDVTDDIINRFKKELCVIIK